SPANRPASDIGADTFPVALPHGNPPAGRDHIRTDLALEPATIASDASVPAPSPKALRAVTDKAGMHTIPSASLRTPHPNPILFASVSSQVNAKSGFSTKRMGLHGRPNLPDMKTGSRLKDEFRLLDHERKAAGARPRPPIPAMKHTLDYRDFVGQLVTARGQQAKSADVTKPNPKGKRGNGCSRVKENLIRYAPLTIAGTSLMSVLPPDQLPLWHGTALALRGMNYLPLAAFLGKFENTRAGNIARWVNVATLVPNLARHVGAPPWYALIYAWTDHVWYAENLEAATKGKAVTVPKHHSMGGYVLDTVANGVLAYELIQNLGPAAPQWPIYASAILVTAGEAYMSVRYGREVAADYKSRKSPGMTAPKSPGSEPNRGLQFAIAGLATGMVGFGISTVLGNLSSHGQEKEEERMAATKEGGDPFDGGPATPGSGVPDPQNRLPQLAVLPEAGLKLRERPTMSSAKISVLKSGTLVQQTGEPVVDRSGNIWVPVGAFGTDAVEHIGWAAARFLVEHSRGVQRPSGRDNPALTGRGLRSVTVQSGETITSIATANGADLAVVLSLNRDHLVAPNLIFPGDMVYLPAAEPAVKSSRS
ncbi:LysM peptidoglycan-binding domain-containing protein, partial [Ensifer sp. ENS02]|uniref:LysM peptidoglycan-binding domain-containing protein n=1 Tax=Ensifer sp. ENS02 TaxID=2769290 RepID=UPI00177B82F8